MTDVFPYILRCRFATHNPEQGIESCFIQEGAGHEGIKTAQRSTLVLNNLFKIKNLPDGMKQGNT